MRVIGQRVDGFQQSSLERSELLGARRYQSRSSEITPGITTVPATDLVDLIPKGACPGLNVVDDAELPHLVGHLARRFFRAHLRLANKLHR